jgi:signal transduction histidine kinase
MRYFQQINRDKQEQQGMGLGLPLAARIIELHAGTLHIDSDTDQGTRLLITLPVEKPSKPASGGGGLSRSMAVRA